MVLTSSTNSAKEFSRSAIARDADFSTNAQERGTFLLPETRPASAAQEWDDSLETRARPFQPTRKVRGSLLVQFAANDGTQLADAAELIKPWVDGIDLNCGTAIRREFLRSDRRLTLLFVLLRMSSEVGVRGRNWVRAPPQARGRRGPRADDKAARRLGIPSQRQDPSRQRPHVRLPPISAPLQPANASSFASLTNELVSTAIAAGADWITVHGRTRHQSSSGHPVDLDSIAFAVSCAKGQVPVVANGDVFTPGDAIETRRRTGAHGVMSARGLLANPVRPPFSSSSFLSLTFPHHAQALFAGYDKTPLSAVAVRPDASSPPLFPSANSPPQEFSQITTDCGLIYPLFHRHMSYMLESHLTKKRERTYFNSLPSHAAVFDFVRDTFGGNDDIGFQGGHGDGGEGGLAVTGEPRVSFGVRFGGVG